ncbi:MAG: VanZ family protein [Firmicutes bacterium]|nr:VanZ family protein [Bacillota bacterium]
MEKRAGTKSAARKAAILHIVITVIVMAVIFVHSAMPGDASTAESDVIVLRILKYSGMDHDFVSFLVRKAAHCAVYMVLGGCLMLNVIDLAKRKASRAAGLDDAWKNAAGLDAAEVEAVRIPLMRTLAWAAGTFYAATDELHQSFVAGRNGSMFDVCLDSVGVLVGVAIVWAVSRKRV